MENQDGSSPERLLYRPLDTSKQQIRLLKPRKTSSSLHYDIEICELTDAPSFKALSYTWGPPTPSFDIFIGKSQTSVRANLFHFLSVYRGDNYLWIDQICINQEDTDERNHQVSFMASIYSQCESIIIWLGTVEIAPDTPIVFNKTKSPWALDLLLQQTYFTRMWIVQEILLSKQKEVLVGHPTLGSVQISWDEMCSITKVNASNPNFKALGVLRDILRATDPHLKDSLGRLIELFSDKHCQDFRDRVYGLMGLVRENERLPIDYGKSIHEIFLDVVHQFIKTHVEKQSTPHAVRANEYPSKAEDYCHISKLLAYNLPFPEGQSMSLSCMLTALWTPELVRCALDITLGIINPGADLDFAREMNKIFEDSLQTHGESGTPHVDEARACWWFARNGERQEFSFTSRKQKMDEALEKFKKHLTDTSQIS